eukprot:11296-Pyramimonas_sp.AAC.1
MFDSIFGDKFKVHDLDSDAVSAVSSGGLQEEFGEDFWDPVGASQPKAQQCEFAFEEDAWVNEPEFQHVLCGE